jgi:hypothetical protein
MRGAMENNGGLGSGPPVRYYELLLGLWERELGLGPRPPLRELLRPDAAAAFEDASVLARRLSEATGLPCTIGGSCFMSEGRSCLVADEPMDIDLRLWARDAGEVGAAADAVAAFAGAAFEETGARKDLSRAPDIRASGGPALSLSWIGLAAGRPAEIQALVRATPRGGIPASVAARRLAALDDEALAGYLRVKGVLYREGGPRLKLFKKSELRLWDVDDALLSFLSSMHEACLAPGARRRSGAGHGEHMTEAAYLSLALGGDWTDFLTAGLHDCIEESGDRARAAAALDSGLRDWHASRGEDDPAGLAAETVARIALMTESFSLDGGESPADRAPGLRARLDSALAALGVDPSAAGSRELAYVGLYAAFNGALVAEAARIRAPELADRWAGMREAGYLEARPRHRRALSLMRWASVLEGLGAPLIMWDELERLCRAHGLDYPLLRSLASSLFSIDERPGAAAIPLA